MKETRKRRGETRETKRRVNFPTSGFNGRQQKRKKKREEKRNEWRNYVKKAFRKKKQMSDE